MCTCVISHVETAKGIEVKFGTGVGLWSELIYRLHAGNKGEAAGKS